MKNFEFEHNIKTYMGSAGCPIILFDSLKVVGVHKHSDKEDPTIKYATFLGEIFKKNIK